MKICIISFDIWGFDNYIKTELKNQKIEAYHICLSKYKFEYKSLFERIKNLGSKVFLKKNIKHINREKYIIDELERLGNFDQILTINPELISLETHRKIKNKTKRYITFLYDSLDRINVKNNILELFDIIFSFDKKDCKIYNFKFITNYIYNIENNKTSEFKYKAFCILSEDNRMNSLIKLDDFFKKINEITKFIVFTNNKINQNTNITYTDKRISINEVAELLNESEIFIDLIRDNQTGLSFRVFESLKLERKLITTNETIKEYDFYNPNNILIIDKNNPIITHKFLDGKYEQVPDAIIKKYELKNWTKIVFNI